MLDTNIIIALFADEEAVKHPLANAQEVFISSIVIGELWYGARKSGRIQRNLERVEEFVVKNTVLECNADTARWYGDIKNQLRVKGRPLPENDIWIAAVALQHNLILVTRDAHFQEVAELQSVAW
ncbi:MAG: type II toxin-antitoxin system VapC family toxin [Leptolyngbyaceae bacterium]|nr:type II toxin-antitoxin system VapC family toxin [Leptolyngbyaceae bacterium]